VAYKILKGSFFLEAEIKLSELDVFLWRDNEEAEKEKP
jgi:hypothetical protein